MKNIIVLLSVVMSGVLAQAGTFDSEVDAREASNALVRCAEEAKALAPANRRTYVKEVSGSFAQISSDVSVKTFTFISMESIGGAFGPPPTVVATLIIKQTVTQPPEGMMDAPSRVTWACELR